MRITGFFLLLLPMTVAAQTVTTLESPVVQNSGRFGQSVTTGDVTGDGVAELIVSTRESEPSNENATGAGRVYILTAEGTVLLTLNPPNPEPDGSFGQAVTVAGDADADDGNDVFICAPNEDPNGLDRSGQLHVFSGATGALIRSQPSPNPEEEGFFCSSLTAVDDLDGDGQDDVLVGAASEAGGAGNAGRVYVFSSATGAVIHTLESPNAFSTSRFGGTLVAAGDFNDDSITDLLISAQGEPVNGVGGAGRVYLFSGSDGTLLHTYDTLDPDGEAAFGTGLAAAGDLNGDGTLDLFVASVIRFGETGKVHAISGTDGTALYTITSPSTQEDDAFANGFDNAIAAVPDIDGDGRTDVLVGAFSDDELGNDAGRAYLFSGADGTLMDSFVSPNAGSISRFGADVAVADATGDGTPDLLIAAPTEAAGEFAAGRSYLLTEEKTNVASEDEPEMVTLDLSVAPNPTQDTALLRFDLAESAPVRLVVYDALGRRVAVLADGFHTAGPYTLRFDAAPLPSGVYLVQLATDRAFQTRTLVLTR